MANNNKPKRVTILTTRAPSKPEGSPLMVFSKDVEVFYKGDKLDLGEYNTVFVNKKDKMLASIDFLLEKDYIDETEAEKRKSFIDEKRIVSEVVVELK